MNKKELRKLYTEKRTRLTHSELEKLNDLLLIQFQRLQLRDTETLLSFWPIAEKNEVDTHSIIDFIQFQNPGIVIAYPVADFSANQMKAIITTDETEFAQNKYGIFEPVSGNELEAEELDAILIPLLAFDENGYRVGYGKGFYDRFLANCREDIIKIGLSYFEAEPKIDDIALHDVQLDYCITAGTIYEFTD